MSYRDTAHNGRRLCVPYHSIRRRPWLVDGIGNGPPISNFLFRAGSPGSVGRHVRRRPLGASIAALMGRHISLPRSSHPPPPRSTTAGSSTRQRVSHSEQTRLPSSLPQYSTYSIFRLVDPSFFFFCPPSPSGCPLLSPAGQTHHHPANHYPLAASTKPRIPHFLAPFRPGPPVGKFRRPTAQV